MALKPGTRVENIYEPYQGTVEKTTVPGFPWVKWDDGRYFPVSEDSLDVLPEASEEKPDEVLYSFTRADLEELAGREVSDSEVHLVTKAIGYSSGPAVITEAALTICGSPDNDETGDEEN